MLENFHQGESEILFAEIPRMQREDRKGTAVERKKASAPLPRYPSLCQINTRVWLTELSHALTRTATLDDIPDTELDRLAGEGFDGIWLLSV